MEDLIFKNIEYDKYIFSYLLEKGGIYWLLVKDDVGVNLYGGMGFEGFCILQ